MSRSRMDKVLTLRLPGPAARRLGAHAKALGKTPSAVVRELLERELGGPTGASSLLERTRQFVGAVRDARVPAGRDAREALAEWTPDRRR